MEWYDLLITDEFINYFSNDNSIYYSDFKSKSEYTPQPLFRKFWDPVTGITYAFQRFDISDKSLLIIKEKTPDVYDAYINCRERMPFASSLMDFWHSIKTEADGSRYDVDVKTLCAEQIAVLILYPFWNRMGGSWEIDFLDSGLLKQYLLALKEKSER